MQRNAAVIRGAWSSLGVLFFVSMASAQMLGTSARQLAPGSLKLLTYYQGVQDQAVRFAVRGTGSCTTAAPSGLPFPCNQAGEIDAEGSGAMAFVKAVYQPWEILQYYGAFGAGEYTLRIPGQSTLTGDDLGMTGTLGLRATIYPDTIVTPGIALDASVSNTRFDFNRSEPAGGAGAQNKINQTLDLRQFQFAVEAGKQFSIEQIKLEPYGGLKWIRTQSDLLDRQDGSHAGGRLDTVTPFLGVRVLAFEREAFFLEAASVLRGYVYGGGLELKFK